jgi:hypothetical protein
MGVALLIVITAASCSSVNALGKSVDRGIILKNDNTNKERNRLLTEDIKFFKKELPKNHKNLFSKITEKEFNTMTDQLINKVDQLSNKQVFVELNKIIASAGDAHTSINYWDGYSYPLQFYILDGKVYVVNAGKEFEDMLFSQVIKINSVGIDEVTEQLRTLVSHENESWVLAMLPNYLQAPVYMYGLGILENEEETVFTIRKDGKEQKFTVPTLEYGESTEYVNTKKKDVLLGIYEKYYDYEYLSDDKAFYFEYNACAEMEDLSFADFNNEMMNRIEEEEVDKIIIDLRSNSGGNSEILNPFTKRLKNYLKEKPDVKIYTLVGRNTFSSGMFAIYRIKEAAPVAVSVGEPTGGALDCYGEVKTMELPNSQLPISYSTKFFEFSKSFSYKNDGVGTFLPDIAIQPTIQDYMDGNDAVLNYVLAD